MEEWQYLRVLFIGGKDDSSILSILPDEVIQYIAQKSMIGIGLRVADNLIWEYTNKMGMARNIKLHYQRMAYLSCDHKWERENTYCGPYDKPPWVCKLCYVDRDDWPVGCGCNKCIPFKKRKKTHL